MPHSLIPGPQSRGPSSTPATHTHTHHPLPNCSPRPHGYPSQGQGDTSQTAQDMVQGRGVPPAAPKGSGIPHTAPSHCPAGGVFLGPHSPPAHLSLFRRLAMLQQAHPWTWAGSPQHPSVVGKVGAPLQTQNPRTHPYCDGSGGASRKAWVHFQDKVFLAHSPALSVPSTQMLRRYGASNAPPQSQGPGAPTPPPSRTFHAHPTEPSGAPPNHYTPSRGPSRAQSRFTGTKPLSWWSDHQLEVTRWSERCGCGGTRVQVGRGACHWEGRGAEGFPPPQLPAPPPHTTTVPAAPGLCPGWEVGRGAEATAGNSDR